jgi:proteic killer suppression protein
MIKSFRDRETEKIYSGFRSSKIDQSIQRIAYRKLRMLSNSHELKDLLAPPSNHLEKLKGNLEGRYSIRINDQYRICFIWKDSDAFEVEIVDCH